MLKFLGNILEYSNTAYRTKEGGVNGSKGVILTNEFDRCIAAIQRMFGSFGTSSAF